MVSGGKVTKSYWGLFLLKVKTICNSDLEITHIIVRYPGNTHDACNEVYADEELWGGEYKDVV